MINDAYVLVTIVGFFIVLCIYFMVGQWRIDRKEIPTNKFPREYKGMETRKKL